MSSRTWTVVHWQCLRWRPKRTQCRKFQPSVENRYSLTPIRLPAATPEHTPSPYPPPPNPPLPSLEFREGRGGRRKSICSSTPPPLPVMANTQTLPTWLRFWRGEAGRERVCAQGWQLVAGLAWGCTCSRQMAETSCIACAWVFTLGIAHVLLFKPC